MRGDVDKPAAWDDGTLQYLLSYVPLQLVAPGRPLLECRAEQFDGAVLFLDISGCAVAAASAHARHGLP